MHSGIKLLQFGKYDVINCKKCGFIHINPIPSQKERFSFYGNEYYQKIKTNYIQGNEKEVNYLNYTFDQKLKKLEKLISSKSKKILDIGSGPGFFLRRAKQRRWDVLGIEPSPIACEYSKKFGIPTIQSFFEHVDFKKIGKFDVIHIFDVLEHVNDPIGILKKSFSLLKKNGILLIEVPNDFNPLQKIVMDVLGKKEYWVTLSNESRNSGNLDHINYFNFSSIVKLIERLGFKTILKQSTFPLEFFLLMGHDYVEDDKIGKMKHLERITFEMNMMKGGGEKLKNSLYNEFANLEIGRTAIIYAKKISSKNQS